MADPFLEQRKQLFQQMQANQMQAFQQQLGALGGGGGASSGGEEDPAAKRQRLYEMGAISKEEAWPELGGGAKPVAAPAADPTAQLLALYQQQAAGASAIPPAAGALSIPPAANAAAALLGGASAIPPAGGAATAAQALLPPAGSTILPPAPQAQQQVAPFLDWAQVGALAEAQKKLQEEEEEARQKTHKYKQEVCEFWLSSKCRKGDRCTFAHGEHELRQAPSGPTLQGIPAAGAQYAKTADNSCWYYERSWCTRGMSCHFMHDPSKIITHPKLGKESSGPAKAQHQANSADAVTLLYQQALMQQLQSDPQAASAYVAALTAQGGYDEATLAALAQWQQALQAHAGAQ